MDGDSAIFALKVGPLDADDSIGKVHAIGARHRLATDSLLRNRNHFRSVEAVEREVVTASAIPVGTNVQGEVLSLYAELTPVVIGEAGGNDFLDNWIWLDLHNSLSTNTGYINQIIEVKMTKVPQNA